MKKKIYLYLQLHLIELKIYLLINFLNFLLLLSTSFFFSDQVLYILIKNFLNLNILKYFIFSNFFDLFLIYFLIIFIISLIINIFIFLFQFFFFF
jgi:hypothetical protein